MHAIVKSSRAERDLFEIWWQLSAHGDAVADRAIRRIERRCEVVQEFPYGGEACPEYGDDMRRISAGNYVIYYRPYSDHIVIARVIDGRRDLPQAFWQS